jgi:NADH-quinone oxidoreductase subunit F
LTPTTDLKAMEPVLREGKARGRTMLLPALLEAQHHYGYVSAPVATAIGEALHVPLADVYSMVEFYDLLSDTPMARTVIRFCGSAICEMAGGELEMQNVCQALGIEAGEPSADGEYLVTQIPCLGLCDHAPNALVGEHLVGSLRANEMQEWLERRGGAPDYRLAGEPRWLTARIGKIQPTSLPDYLSQGGFAGLRNVLQHSPEEVIAMVKASGLVGRGGAAFPTDLKWDGAAKAPGQPKYIVLNADESEVGTFKDRVLLENDPFSVLEGMLIAAYAVGASYGFLYVRGEYRHAQQVLAEAVHVAQEAGYLGKDIQGSGFSFQVELRSGAGAYICGEETAQFESIEGKRGFPRMKPPFPTTHGVFGKPTVINNVETFCNLPLLFSIGVDAYRQMGTQTSSGPKLFCLSGDVERPCLVEAPFGLTLRELIDRYGGGVRQGRQIQAVLLGGAAGFFVPPELLDVRLTFEDLRDAGLALGSGAVMVFDDSRDLRKILLNLAHFFAHESCGKCYPCQLGTQRQLEVLERLAAGEALPGDLERLQDVGWTMTDASICGLGQTAALATLSAIQHWPGVFQPTVARK